MNIKNIYNKSDKLYTLIIITIIVFLGLLVLKCNNNKRNLRENMYSNKPEFIESKQFKGSKKGYVFKMDKKGLGYYIDIKPKITI